MSAFSGAQGKGAMKRRRDEKRDEATERNKAADPRLWMCGHVSSSADHPCEVSA